jgi:suppressor of G2 allele of SKP1
MLQGDSSDAYAKRANCHIKLRKFKEGVIDANTAISIDGRNARAHLRRGIGLFYLSDYENSKKAFEAGLSVATTDKETFETWVKRCNASIKGSKPPEPKASKQTTQATPTPTPAKAPAPAPAKAPASTPAPAAVPTKAATQAPVNTAPSTPKIRHEWYQNDLFVFVTIFAKNVAQEKANIKFEEQNLSVSIKITEDNSYELDLDLFGKILTKECSFGVTPSKVEIKLRKADAIKWNALEAAEDSKPYTPITNAKKNWDAIVKEDAVEEDKSEMGFLRDLYAGATEEEKRAIMKSMEQSGGTVLNMNWGEVENKQVKPKPSEWALNQPERNEDSSDSDDDAHWERRAEERAKAARRRKH